MYGCALIQAQFPSTQGLDAPVHLACNDSYHFFEALRDLVRPGQPARMSPTFKSFWWADVAQAEARYGFTVK
jgi:hypothetical protein